jgi:LysM domain
VQEGEKAGPDRATTRSTGRPTLFRPAPPTASRDAIPICPYLVREGPDQALGPAMSAVDPANRCVALGSPVPQSSRQQELVCLTAAHASCPRYLRGAQLAGAPPVPPKREPVSTAVIVATLVFVASIAASFAFLAVRGGFDLGLPTPAPSQVAAASLPPTPGPGGSPAPSVAPTAGESVPPSIEPSPSAKPTPSPTPSVTPRPTSSPTPTPRPSSNRFALLTPCPSTDNCWIYVIRSGDNLVSIANYFGVDYDRVRKMNPRLRIPIHAGDQLRMPTPTR